jgi:hypothetical protein
VSRAEVLNARGNELLERGWLAEAEAAFREAAAADPRWAAPRYNLGLLFKRSGRWRESMVENRAALGIDPDDEAARWNLAIAATALGNWNAARDAWRGCGIGVPDGEGPPAMDLGMVPVRLRAERGEVVWCRRVDPARAVVLNIPLPGSGHAWGDEVLHDGAPNGYRRHGGQDVPVFDELAVLKPSGYRTFEIELEGVGSRELDRLVGIAEAEGGCVEDWSRTVRCICRQCSEGLPRHVHDEDLRAARAPTGCGVAARSRDHLDAILTVWLREAPSSSVTTRREVAP